MALIKVPKKVVGTKGVHEKAPVFTGVLRSLACGLCILNGYNNSF
ncbi:hypothetical protein [Winogradskyella flava]|nr:hypothetical protein [Winogradskyella flava]